MRKSTIEQMREIARSRGGKCLSVEYVNEKTKLLWQCAEGHRWNAAPRGLKHGGSWCPVCARKNAERSLTIEKIREIAETRGGKCLSAEYVNEKTKLLWQCAEGHQWAARPTSVRYGGGWCPVCVRNRLLLTIEQMRQIACSRGGKCLSSEYINCSAKLLWQCAEGHQWEAEPSSIKRGRWCPACAGKQKLTIEQMREIAESSGGKCLSGEYVGINTKLLWQCAERHRWNATPRSVKHNGTWCPECYRIKQQKK